MNRLTRTAAAAVLILASAGSAAAATYEIDPAHSEILFKVRHLGISTVTGSFRKFSGTFTYDPENLKASSARIVVDTASIDTGIEKRDEHLRSEDFLHVKEHPEAVFESKKVIVKDKKKGRFHLVGDLTLRGVTKEVVLEVQTGGIAKDPWGNQRAAFEAKTTLNRLDFGIKWNKTLDTGGLVVDEKVHLQISVEGIQK